MTLSNMHTLVGTLDSPSRQALPLNDRAPTRAHPPGRGHPFPPPGCRCTEGRLTRYFPHFSQPRGKRQGRMFLKGLKGKGMSWYQPRCVRLLAAPRKAFKRNC